MLYSDYKCSNSNLATNQPLNTLNPGVVRVFSLTKTPVKIRWRSLTSSLDSMERTSLRHWNIWEKWKQGLTVSDQFIKTLALRIKFVYTIMIGKKW